MASPCGHKEAVCIIGSYYQCSVCETSKTLEVEQRPNKSDLIAFYRSIPCIGGSRTLDLSVVGGKKFSRFKTRHDSHKWGVHEDDIVRSSATWIQIKDGSMVYSW